MDRRAGHGARRRRAAEEILAGEDVDAGPSLARAAAARQDDASCARRIACSSAGGSASPQARELVPYLRELGISHLYLPPSFQARAGSTHGYDVVDPGSISEELGGADEFHALVAGRARGRAGDRARHRPEPHGDRRREPLLGRPGAAARSSSTSIRRPGATGASSTSTTWPPCARRTRRCSRRRTSWRCGSCARASSTGCGSTIRTGSRTRRATWRGCAPRACEHVWVEKILDPGEHLRDWPVEGTVGYEFLNDVCALFVDPAGEAPLTDLWVEVSGDDRRFGELAFEAKLEQARTTFAPEVERLAREAPERVTGLERALASLRGLPHLRGAVVGPRGGRRPRGGRGGRAAALAGVGAAAGAPGLGRVRHALPADDAAGHGQGRRGHGVLPLRAAAGVERRRRRPVALLVVGRRLPRREPRARSGASRATCSSRRRTTRSAPATCGRGSARWPGWRTRSRPTCGRGCRCAGR